MKYAKKDSLLIKVLCPFLAVIVFFVNTWPAKAATTSVTQTATTPPPPEPYELLYVIFNEEDPKTIGIELHNQIRRVDGSISALVSVRADNLIAYNLTFETSDAHSDYLTTMTFLPLYPGHTYEIGTIILEPGGYFEVTATPFGMSSDDVRNKMTVIQLAVLVMHLAGARPPTNVYEGIKAIPDAFEEVWGPIGAIAGFVKAVWEIFETKDASGETLIALGEVIAEAPGGSESLADLVNLITLEAGVKLTSTLIDNIFKAINIFNLIGNVKTAVDAFVQLKTYPVYITATVTPAPEIVQTVDRYQVFELNEPYQVDLAYKNISSEIWEPDADYSLSILVEGIPFFQLPLENLVTRDQIAYWSFRQNAFAVPGIYHITYQMTYNGTLIGKAIPGEIVVVPEKSDSLKDLINGLVEDAFKNVGDQLEQAIKELEFMIAQAIINEITQRLRELCGGTGLYLSAGLVLYWNVRRSRRKQRENEALVGEKSHDKN
jgi:hypothetical protein